MKTKLNLRKVILINKKFQLSVLLSFAILILIVELLFYFATVYFFKCMQDDAIVAGLSPNHIFFSYLNNQKYLMQNIFILTACISTLIIFLGGIYLSHRIAGPLYRLTKHFQNSSLSNVQQIKFRKNDYFPEIEKAFNEFIQRK